MATDPVDTTKADLEELSRLTLKAFLSAMAKEDVRASTLAAATKYLDLHSIPASTREQLRRAAIASQSDPPTFDENEDRLPGPIQA